jgi:hypothetical protein
VSVTGEHQVQAKSNLMRCVHGGWLFVVFILVSVYTANMATTLTAGDQHEFKLASMEEAASYQVSAAWISSRPRVNWSLLYLLACCGMPHCQG